MKFITLHMINQFEMDCLQLELACTQVEVEQITHRGWLCRPLLPYHTEANFVGLTFYCVTNKTLLIQMPPGYLVAEIASCIRKECAELEDDLYNANKLQREKQSGLESTNEAPQKKESKLWN